MILAIIQSRLDSKRLPQKALMNMAGKPMVKHVIDRVSQVQSVHAVTVATSQGGNGLLAAKCDDWGVPCFQWSGPVDDVLGRLVACAAAYRWQNPETGELESVEHVLRVCGDNPLFDPQAADELIAQSVIHGADYTGYSIRSKPAITIPNGYFGEVVKMSALRRANKELSKDATEREHVTACMYAADQSRFSKPFTCRLVPAPTWYGREKLKNAAVDTRADFERVREFVEKE